MSLAGQTEKDKIGFTVLLVPSINCIPCMQCKSHQCWHAQLQMEGFITGHYQRNHWDETPLDSMWSRICQRNLGSLPSEEWELSLADSGASCDLEVKVVEEGEACCTTLWLEDSTSPSLTPLSWEFCEAAANKPKITFLAFSESVFGSDDEPIFGWLEADSLSVSPLFSSLSFAWADWGEVSGRGERTSFVLLGSLGVFGKLTFTESISWILLVPACFLEGETTNWIFPDWSLLTKLTWRSGCFSSSFLQELLT